MTKVLVVDDEKDVLDLLVDDLEDSGFEVVSAENGAAALGKIYREHPDIVLLDLMMPVLNGYEVLGKLRADPTTKNLPVILLTAVSAAEGEQTAVQLGANHYVTKPWDPGTIQAVIKVALREASDSGGGVYDPGSAFVSTGNPLLNTKLGGGIPATGLTLIEGGSSTGKSVLCQHFAHAAYTNGIGVAYFSTQYSPNALISQLGSMGMDPSKFFRSGLFRINPLRQIDPTQDCGPVLEDLATKIIQLPVSYRFAIVDAVSSLINAENEGAILNFFQQCKQLSEEGKSIVLSVDPMGLHEDTMYRIRAMSDGYLALRLEKSGARLNNILEVCKVHHAVEMTGNIVNFEVEPGVGIKVDSTYRVPA